MSAFVWSYSRIALTALPVLIANVMDAPLLLEDCRDNVPGLDECRPNQSGLDFVFECSFLHWCSSLPLYSRMALTWLPVLMCVLSMRFSSSLSTENRQLQTRNVLMYAPHLYLPREIAGEGSFSG